MTRETVGFCIKTAARIEEKAKDRQGGDSVGHEETGNTRDSPPLSGRLAAVDEVDGAADTILWGNPSSTTSGLVGQQHLGRNDPLGVGGTAAARLLFGGIGHLGGRRAGISG